MPKMIKMMKINNRLLMKQLLILLISAIALSGCIVKPFKSPSAEQIKLDSLYRYATDTTHNVAQMHWREIFTNKGLQDLVDTVLANNFDFQISLLRIEQGYSKLRAARAAIAPSIGATAGYGMGAGGSIGLGFNWEIDMWGKLYAGKESAKADFWQTEQATLAVRQTLIATTAISYYQLIALEAKRKVILETIENRTVYLATTRLLKEAGKVNEVAVQQAISQLAEVNAALPQTEMSIAMTENAIALLAGRGSIKITQQIDFNFAYSDITIATGYPAQLLSFRPDVRAAEMNYRSKHYLHMAARAALYPSLTLSADASLIGAFSAQSVILNTLAGLTAPIFQGRKLRANKEVAAAEAKIAEIQFRNSVFTAFREVNDAMITVRSNDARTTSQAVQLAALKKAYQYSEELFINGYATYLDVLVAQTGVYNAQMGLIDTYLSSLTARINLYRALGGGAEGATILPAKICDGDPAVKNSKSNRLNKQKSKDKKIEVKAEK